MIFVDSWFTCIFTYQYDSNIIAVYSKKKLDEKMTNDELDALCVSHISIKNKLDDVKASELELRKKICKVLVDIDKGPKRKTLSTSNFKVTAASKTNITFEKDDDGNVLIEDESYDDLDDETQACIKRRISVDSTAFKKLMKRIDNDELDFEPDIIDYIEESPATPTLSIKEIG